MIYLLVINTVILFLIAERIKPIVGGLGFDFDIVKYIKINLLRRRLKIGDYYAHVGYKDIDHFMIEEKIDEIVVIKNFGKKYIEVEVIEERNKQSTLSTGFNQITQSSKKFVAMRNFVDYYIKYSGKSPGIKKIDFGKEMNKL